MRLCYNNRKKMINGKTKISEKFKFDFVINENFNLIWQCVILLA